MSKTICRTALMATLVVALLGAGTNAKERAARGKLPEAVAKALEAEFPGAEVFKADSEKENGVTIYDVEFRQAGIERECDVAADGTILNTAIVVDAKNVPEAAMKAFVAAAGGGSVGRIERSEVRAEPEAGKIRKLDKARIEFEAEIAKDGRRAEITVAEDGTVLEAPKWAEAGAREGRERR